MSGSSRGSGGAKVPSGGGLLLRLSPRARPPLHAVLRLPGPPPRGATAQRIRKKYDLDHEFERWREDIIGVGSRSQDWKRERIHRQHLDLYAERRKRKVERLRAVENRAQLISAERTRHGAEFDTTLLQRVCWSAEARRAFCGGVQRTAGEANASRHAIARQRRLESQRAAAELLEHSRDRYMGPLPPAIASPRRVRSADSPRSAHGQLPAAAQLRPHPPPRSAAAASTAAPRKRPPRQGQHVYSPGAALQPTDERQALPTAAGADVAQFRHTQGGTGYVALPQLSTQLTSDMGSTPAPSAIVEQPLIAG